MSFFHCSIIFSVVFHVFACDACIGSFLRETISLNVPLFPGCFKQVTVLCEGRLDRFSDFRSLPVPIPKALQTLTPGSVISKLFNRLTPCQVHLPLSILGGTLPTTVTTSDIVYCLTLWQSLSVWHLLCYDPHCLRFVSALLLLLPFCHTLFCPLVGHRNLFPRWLLLSPVQSF